MLARAWSLVLATVLLAAASADGETAGRGKGRGRGRGRGQPPPPGFKVPPFPTLSLRNRSQPAGAVLSSDTVCARACRKRS